MKGRRFWTPLAGARAAVLAALLWPGGALAAEGGWADAVDALGLTLIELVAAALAALLVGLAVRGLRWLGLAVEHEHRDALERAIRAGLGHGIERAAGGALARLREPPTRQAAVAEAAAYVLRSTPDALARFGIGPQRLAEMVAARLAIEAGAPPAEGAS